MRRRFDASDSPLGVVLSTHCTVTLSTYTHSSLPRHTVVEEYTEVACDV